MNFRTTAEDCKYLINHYIDAKRRFFIKSKSVETPLSDKMCYIGRMQWPSQRIKYYTEKLERLERRRL